MSCASWYLDIGKTLLGTVIGAGLAFWFGLRTHAIKKRDEDRAAGNFAVFVISQHLNDLLNVRNVFRIEEAKCAASAPGVPRWLGMPTIGTVLNRTAKIDYASLGFLLTHKKNFSVMPAIAHAETLFTSFADLLDEQFEARKVLQRKAAAAGFDLSRRFTLEELERVVGRDLTSLVKGTTDAIFDRFERDDAEYRRVGGELHDALREYFKGDGAIMRLKSREELAESEATSRSVEGGRKSP